MPLHLTFDDGPSLAWTPVVLAALERIGATATFFVLAGGVRAHPAIVRGTVDAGHAVELQADCHVRHDRMTLQEIRADTTSALAALAAVDVRPSWWRTPWGRITDDPRIVAAEHDLGLLDPHVDTHDWRGDTAEAMLAATVAGAPEGGVVLAHDAVGPGALRDGCEETVRFVTLVGAWARRQGLALEALPARRHDTGARA